MPGWLLVALASPAPLTPFFPLLPSAATPRAVTPQRAVSAPRPASARPASAGGRGRTESRGAWGSTQATAPSGTPRGVTPGRQPQAPPPRATSAPRGTIASATASYASRELARRDHQAGAAAGGRPAASRSSTPNVAPLPRQQEADQEVPSGRRGVDLDKVRRLVDEEKKREEEREALLADIADPRERERILKIFRMERESFQQTLDVLMGPRS